MPEELKNITIALRERGSGTLSAVSEALQKSKISIADIKKNCFGWYGGLEKFSAR
jgi:hypothetical protein